jgi:hypothetical protein
MCMNNKLNHFIIEICSVLICYYCLIKIHLKFCRVSGDFLSKLRDPFPDVFPVQKFHVNMGLIHSGYGGMGI